MAKRRSTVTTPPARSAPATVPATAQGTPPKQRPIPPTIAAAKPGAVLGRGTGTVYEVAFNYINSHGKDLNGRPLGEYFIHGLGHSVGLNVHDPMDYTAPLAPGMIVTAIPSSCISARLNRGDTPVWL